MAGAQQHWESVYQKRDHELVSWYQASPERSLRLVTECGIPSDAPIIDIGGGSSLLVDGLVDLGYSDVTVLDLSATALAVAQRRLGPLAGSLTWIEADVTTHQFDRPYAVWHDRAVLHFLTDRADQARYVAQSIGAVPVGGSVIIATFALDGPEQCSGLPVQRYGPESLSQTLGPGFEAMAFETEAHHTPGGATQEFLYGRFRRTAPPPLPG